MQRNVKNRTHHQDVSFAGFTTSACRMRAERTGTGPYWRRLLTVRRLESNFAQVSRAASDQVLLTSGVEAPAAHMEEKFNQL